MSPAERNAMLIAAALHRLEVVERRVTHLESGRKGRDQALAQAERARWIAVELGLPLGCLTDTGKHPRLQAERVRLARELRTRRWTIQQIAGVLNCSTRTIDRFFEKETKP